MQPFAVQLSIKVMKVELRATELHNAVRIIRDDAWEDGIRCEEAELRQRFQ